MKLQLDTVDKTIKIEADIVLSELTETLEKLLPKGEWKKFTLQTNTIINNWNSPVVIEKYYPRTYPWYVGVQYLAGGNNNTISLKSGTYNVQC